MQNNPKRNILAVLTSLGLMCSAHAFVPEGYDAKTLMFYPLTEQASGTTWNGVEGDVSAQTRNTGLKNNAGNAGYEIEAKVAQKSYVMVTNEVPGKYLYSSKTAKAPMVASYQSIRAVSDCPDTSGRYGGWFSIANFGKNLATVAATTKAFTIEMFVKPCDPDCYKNFYTCYFDVGAQNEKGRIYVRIPLKGDNDTNKKTVGVQTTAGNVPGHTSEGYSTITLSGAAVDSAWHHVALVYTEDPNTAGRGTVRFYYDYKAAENVAWTLCNGTSSATTEIRFGGGGGIPSWSGLFSAIRVSNQALTPDEMLYASNSEDKDDKTIAFYPLTEQASGTTWVSNNPSDTSAATLATGLKNNAGSGEYEIQAKVAQKSYVMVTNEVPGKYLYSSKTAKAPMVDSYQSIRAVANCPNTTGRYGGWFEISHFGRYLSQTAAATKSFTLEMFAKPCDLDCEKDYTALYFDIGTGDRGRITVRIPLKGDSAANKKSVSVQTIAGNVPGHTSQGYSTIALPDSAIDLKWHHIAVVYTEDPTTAGQGSVRFYYDYQAAADAAWTVREATSSTTTANIRLCGSGGIPSWGGLISAIRATGQALTPDEMLHISDRDDGVDNTFNTIAYYPLDDQEPGTVFDVLNRDPVTQADRDFWSNKFINKAQTGGWNSTGKGIQLGVVKKTAGANPDVEFYMTNDVPARYIYPSLRATDPLCAPKASLAALTPALAGSANKSDFIQFSSVSLDLFKAEAFTVEFFAKFLSQPSLFAYFDIGPDNANRYMLQKKSSPTGTLQFDFSYLIDKTTRLHSYSNVTYPDETDFVDGKWHHFAIVHANGKSRLYCDYTLLGEEVVTPKGASVIDSFRLSNGGQWAHYSNFRATAAALDPQEFLYASDNADGVLGSQGWRWTMDGTIGGTTAVVASDLSGEDADQYLFKDGHGFSAETEAGGTLTYVQPVVRGRRMVGGVSDGKNRSALAFGGTEGLSAVVKGVLCDPGTAFTVESLVNVEKPASGERILFGAENLAGELAWCVVVDANGHPQFVYKTAQGDTAFLPCATNPSFALTGGPHPFAMVADLRAKTVSFYSNYKLVGSLGESDFATGIALDGSYFAVGGGCGYPGAVGAIDEVRVTRSLLDPSEFTMINVGFMILIR